VSTTYTRPLLDTGGNAAGLRLDPLRPRRRPALAAASLALVVACIAVFTSVYLRAGSQMSVLAIARAVPEGQMLNVGDLTVVRISTTSGIATVPAAEASAVTGRRAAERLQPGTLLATSELVTSYSPPAGEAIVGVALKEGQFPASGVAPGDTVDVILTGSPGSVGSGATVDGPSAGATPSEQPGTVGTVLVPDASVLEMSASPVSSGTDGVDVSLLTTSALAPLVANASAAGQVALVIVAPGS
jgi:hypothetical protein